MPTIRPRGGRFQAQVRIKQHGRIVHQESATFDTEKQATLWGLTLEKKLEREGIAAHRGDKASVADVIDKQKVLLTKLKRNLRGYTTSFKLILESPLADRPIAHVTTNEIASWVVDLATTARDTTDDGDELFYAPATLLHALMTLRAAYNNATTMLGVPANVAVVAEAIKKLTKLRVIGKSSWRDRRVSDSEVDLIGKHFENSVHSNLPMGDILRLAIALPRRRTELLTMRWENYTGETIMLMDTKDPTVVRRDECIPVPVPAQEILAKLPRTSDLVLPYNPFTVTNAFITAVAELGLVNLRLHDMRHEGISRLFAQGLDIPDVAMISGHKNWNTLRRYTHLRPQDVLEKLKRNQK